MSLLGLYEMRLTLERRDFDLARIRRGCETLAALNEHDRFKGAAMAFVNEVAARWACQRVAIGFLKGRYVQLKAISHTEKFSRKMKLVQETEAAMEECLDQDVEVLYPPAPDAAVVSRAAAELSAEPAFLHRPLPAASSRRRSRRRAHARALPPTVRSSSTRSSRCVSPANSAPRGSSSCTSTIAGSARAWSRLHRERPRPRRRPQAHLGQAHRGRSASRPSSSSSSPGATTAPKRRSSSRPSSARSSPLRSTASSSPSPSSPATRSPPARPLARSRHRRAAAPARRGHARNGAVSDKQGAAAMRDAKTAEAQIAQAQADSRSRKMNLLDNEILRADLVSPIKGVVLTGDLKRNLGAPVKTGDVLFEVAPLEALRGTLSVPEGQIADVLVGQTGELATVTYPDQRVTFTVERINPVAEVVKGQNVFKVRVELADFSPDFRPGMEGVAKISIERRHYAWIWTRRLTGTSGTRCVAMGLNRDRSFPVMFSNFTSPLR